MLCNYTNHTSQFLLHVCIHSTVPASMLHPCHYLYYLQGQRLNYLHSHSLCQQSMMITICSYVMLGNVSVHVDILSCCLPVGDHLVGCFPAEAQLSRQYYSHTVASALLGARCVLTSDTKEWMGWHRVALFVGFYWEAANQMIPNRKTTTKCINMH